MAHCGHAKWGAAAHVMRQLRLTSIPSEANAEHFLKIPPGRHLARLVATAIDQDPPKTVDEAHSGCYRPTEFGGLIPAMWKPPPCLFLIAALLGVSGCGSAPTAPTPLDLTGHWTASATISKAVGGDCVGPTITQTMIGVVRPYSIQLVQTGTTVTGSVTNPSTGGAWTVSGTVSSPDPGAHLSLHSTASTNAPQLGFTCSDGSIRDILPVSLAISATVTNKNAITGTYTEDTNENIEPGGVPITTGGMRLTSTLAMSR